MKRRTKSVGINCSGYPASASHFIVDNGCLVLIDSLIENGHETILFDYNTVDMVEDLKVPEEIQSDLEQVVKRIMSCQTNIDPYLLQELNNIESHIDDIRESKVRLKGNDLIKYCKENDIDFVWMKLWTGDGFKYSKALAEQLKEAIPSLLIVGGGHHVRLFREKTYELTESFDLLAYGDGENLMPLIADWVLGNREVSSIPGVLYRKDGQVVDTKGEFLSSEDQLNSMVVPEDFMARYQPLYSGLADKILIGLTETSRGCPENHVFCQHSKNCGDYWRLIDPDIVVENINRYNKNDIFVNRIPDSNPPMSHLKKIYGMMKERQLHKNLITAFCEIPQFDKEFAQLFKDVGGYCLFFGIESGSRKVLRTIGKNYAPEEAEKKIKMAKDLGIVVVTSFMVPSIGDNEDTIKETEEWIREVSPDYWPVVPTVPMSRMLDDPQRYGYELGEDYFEKLQLYTIKLHLPPQLGGTLPVKKDGMDWNQIKAVSGDFVNSLKGVGTSLVSDETAMLAYLAREEAGEFNTNFTDYLRKGDTEPIREYISTINENVKHPYNHEGR
jgi:hypothetical protein